MKTVKSLILNFTIVLISGFWTSCNNDDKLNEYEPNANGISILFDGISGPKGKTGYFFISKTYILMWQDSDYGTAPEKLNNLLIGFNNNFKYAHYSDLLLEAYIKEIYNYYLDLGEKMNMSLEETIKKTKTILANKNFTYIGKSYWFYSGDLKYYQIDLFDKYGEYIETTGW